MKLLAHPDPHALERELVRRVDAVHPRDRPGRTLVVVPTERLAGHVAVRLAAARPAWLGLELLQFQALSRAILARAGEPIPSVVGPRLLESILERVLVKRPEGLWATLARRRPGLVRALAETLNDLREAGTTPGDAAAACAAFERGDDLARTFAAYHEALEATAARGWTDAAGLARLARPHAAAFARDLDGAFVHGAYEVVGVHLDLLREIDRTAGLTALLPLAPGAPATRHAERFARAFLLDPGADFERLDDGPDAGRAARLRALYDEEARPEPASAGAITLRHAQGPAAEVRAAARQALADAAAGCPPEEISIVARSLAPYAAALEEVLEAEGLRWASSLAAPLRRQPVVRDFLLLLGVLDDGFPRRATALLLRSPRIAWTALAPDGVPRGDRADAWSRKARILGGLDEWTADLTRWAAALVDRPGRAEDPGGGGHAERRLGDVRRIGQALAALDAALPRQERTWSEHAERLLHLAARVLCVPRAEQHAAAHDALRELLADMRRLEELCGDTRRVSFSAAREWLEHAADRAELPARVGDGGGLRVLDLMQARGMTFRRAHLLGLNATVFPRPPREDAVLPDAARRAIVAATGRPLSIKADGAEEERLLLAQALACAAERLDVSWQRAEESGRALTPSPALREVARTALGRPDAPALRERALHLPSHPEHWLATLADRTRMLAPGEARLQAALAARDDASIAALGSDFPDLACGVRMLRATQAFEPGIGEYDGRVGPLAGPTLSVSGLEQLGRCPLQFFFARVLRVGEFDEEASVLALSNREVGTELHAALAAVYAALDAEGLFDAGRSDAARLLERARELLEARRPHLLGEIGARLVRRLPLLGDHELSRWHATLERFVLHDLARIRAGGWRPASIETLREDAIDAGADGRIELRGKFDRLLAREDRLLVGDYKTSAKVKDHVGRADILSGTRLQAALYWKMAGPESTVELLALHPDVDLDGQDARATFGGFDKPDEAQSFDDTLGALVSLWRRGVFPFREDDQRCGWCDFAKACRRSHPPSQQREQLHADAAAFRAVTRKNTRNVHGK